jgi:hypothetical protein
VADAEAVAIWAAEQGKTYRRVMSEAIPESLRLGRMALDFLVRRSDAGGSEPQVEVCVCVSCGRPGLGRKINTMKLIGTIVDETATRLVLRGGGAFCSLPTSTIMHREVRGDRADLP